MEHPLRRFASSPSLAFGGRGTHPVAGQSRFHGCPDRGTSRHEVLKTCCTFYDITVK